MGAGKLLLRVSYRWVCLPKRRRTKRQLSMTSYGEPRWTLIPSERRSYVDSPMLSDYQIYQFVRYRTDHQAFHELSELKLVPGWSLSLIALLHPVIVLSPHSRGASLAGKYLRSHPRGSCLLW